jgi:hypothetical protein
VLSCKFGDVSAKDLSNRIASSLSIFNRSPSLETRSLQLRHALRSPMLHPAHLVASLPHFVLPCFALFVGRPIRQWSSLAAVQAWPAKSPSGRVAYFA